MHSIAVEENVVRRSDHCVGWNHSTCEACADEQPIAVVFYFGGSLDQFVNTRWTEDFVLVAWDVGFVIDLDYDVCIAFFENPFRGVIYSGFNCVFVF